MNKRWAVNMSYCRRHRRNRKIAIPHVYMIKRKDVKIIRSKMKGRGLVADIDLSPNSHIFYTGSLLTKHQFQQMIENGDDVSYIMKTGHKQAPFVNGLGNVGSLINEPSTGERANVIIRFTPNSPFPKLVTTKHIRRNEEILLHYGGAYKRNYRAGRRAIVPKWIRREH